METGNFLARHVFFVYFAGFDGFNASHRYVRMYRDIFQYIYIYTRIHIHAHIHIYTYSIIFIFESLRDENCPHPGNRRERKEAGLFGRPWP